MTGNQRIALNMAAQYTRSVVNVLLSLYATRLLLLGLGQTDFGIYSVVAGVIALLSFVTNALVTTTQRYLSYYCNHPNPDKPRNVFASSLWLHILIGLGLLLLLLAMTRPIIHQLLVIDADRLSAATMVYIISAATLFLNFLCAPFRAAFVAHENIVYISVIDILDAILRLLIAVILLRCLTDRLVLYASLLFGISVVNILLIGGYSLYLFPETRAVSPCYASRDALKDISQFIGWSIYSSACILIRTQGLAVIINRTFGSIANAAYGIAQQVLNAVYFLYSAIVNAMNPGLMRAEGEGDRQRMLSIALTECKVAYLVMLAVCVPLIAEMPAVLHIWLGNVPEYAVALCRMTLLGCLIDQLTLGLNSANQATGKIATYSLLVNTTKAITILFAAIIAHYALSIHLPGTGWELSTFRLIIVCYLAFETLSMLLRLPHLRRSAGLSIRYYMRQVAVPLVLPTLLVGISALGMHALVEPSVYRLIGTLLLCFVIWIISTWLLALNRNERHTILTLFHLG